MVDLEPVLEAPFESASNRSFEFLLLSGVALLGCVALVGRTVVTEALVALYLLAIPGYVAFRVRVRDGASDDHDGDRTDAAEDGDDAGDRNGEDSEDRTGETVTEPDPGEDR